MPVGHRVAGVVDAAGEAPIAHPDRAAEVELHELGHLRCERPESIPDARPAR